MTPRTTRAVLAAMMLTFLLIDADVALARRAGATVDELLDLNVKPFAIGHRGFGENLGEDPDPSLPIENTLRSVRRAFRSGISVVEIDVQVTSDHEVVVFHDDFFSEDVAAPPTCLNTLTRAELHERLPYVPTLREALDEAKRFNTRPGPISGLVIIELKAPAPLCDPDDSQERAIVAAVTRVVRDADMSEQVMFTSFSPALLLIASHRAPEITRILSLNGLQFLTAKQIFDRYHLDVTLIDKQRNLGLQWAEIDVIFRLPGYRSVAEVLSTAAVIGVRIVEADLRFLESAGAPFVDTLHALGLKVIGFTATSPEDWLFLESLGLDGIYTDDVPFGVAHQAPIP
jgi:glycerophosphoryl diester phosphodiesterase